MKPDTTWKEPEFVGFVTGVGPILTFQSVSKDEKTAVVALDDLLKFDKELQALARREGIEEAMRVVKGMDMGSICSAHQKRDPLCQMCNSSDKYNMALRHVVEALQEKLDTKGE